MPAFLFLCPLTGLNVQGWMAEEPIAAGQYESVECTACRRLHLIDPRTGRVAGTRRIKPTENIAPH